MRRRIVKRNRAVDMRSPFREVADTCQGNAHGAMPDRKREFIGSLFLGEC
jgi:hypothetical protein